MPSVFSVVPNAIFTTEDTKNTELKSQPSRPSPRVLTQYQLEQLTEIQRGVTFVPSVSDIAYVVRPWRITSIMERRQTVDNRGDKLFMIFTEPEAQDYWLKPGDEFEIRAPITDAKANFKIALHEEGISVYHPHGMGYISVWCGDEELHVGHQRPAGWGK